MSGTHPGGWSYEKYLAAKVTVDDRALNRHVVDAVRSHLSTRGSEEPLRVLELGGGTGTMVRRLLEWKLLTRAEYSLVDADERLLNRGLASLREWAHHAGFTVREVDSGEICLRGAGGTPTVDVRTEAAEVFDFLSSPREANADLLVASAFLDLVELPRVLPQLLKLLAPRGVFWFPINFDGESIFEPSHPLDAPLMAAYHRTMDERIRYGRPAGNSRTGRKLFHSLRAAGADVHAAGSSDWVVHARDGRYPDKEDYFLGCILATIEEALSERADVDASELLDWLGARRSQMKDATLVYIAHQLDFFGSRATA